MTEVWDGFISGVSDYDYHRMPGVSPSKAKPMLVSPRAYKHSLSVPFKTTDAMRLGTACHIAVLEPDTFLDRVIEWSGGTRRGPKWEEFQTTHADKVILTEDAYATAHNIRFRINEHAAIRNIIERGGIIERGMKWTSENGMRCRGRVDLVSDAIYDLKFVADISDRAVINAVIARAYHMQGASYCDGHLRLTGEVLPFKLIFIEAEKSHDARIVHVTGDEIEHGLKLWNECLDKIKACEESGEWPGIAPEETQLVLPEWVFGSGEELNLTFDGESIGM